MLNEDDVTQELLERMEEEVGLSPDWFILDDCPEEDSRIPQVTCDINKIGFSADTSGKEHEAHNIIKTFYYVIEG